MEELSSCHPLQITCASALAPRGRRGPQPSLPHCPPAGWLGAAAVPDMGLCRMVLASSRAPGLGLTALTRAGLPGNCTERYQSPVHLPVVTLVARPRHGLLSRVVPLPAPCPWPARAAEASRSPSSVPSVPGEQPAFGCRFCSWKQPDAGCRDAESAAPLHFHGNPWRSHLCLCRVFNEGKRSPCRRLEPAYDPRSQQPAEEAAWLFEGAFLGATASNRVTKTGFLLADMDMPHKLDLPTLRGWAMVHHHVCRHHVKSCKAGIRPLTRLLRTATAPGEGAEELGRFVSDLQA